MRVNNLHILFTITFFLTVSCTPKKSENRDSLNFKLDSILELMSLEEKIGQMVQKNSGASIDSLIKEGMIGSILNEVNVEEINRLQRVAVEKSRLGIPILFARDVIHGFKTIMPIPLGQAASWNPELVKKCAETSAVEARSGGIRWTFAPMIDITRDPRWGRIAEGFGEDTYLTTTLAVAAVKGYQGDNLKSKYSIAACAKHFAAYGAAEGGRDYHTVTLPENELRDIYLQPFKGCADNNALTFMTAFNEINGIPATGNSFLIRQILRDEWNYKGMVVSDWQSVQQLVVHGYAKDNKDAAQKALNAGVDMEMASTTYEDYIIELLKEGVVSTELINQSVRNILRIKFQLGLFEDPYTNTGLYPKPLNKKHLEVSKEIAKQSLVLLKNRNGLLPIDKNISSIAVIGPLADAPHDQLGTWIFDGDKKHSVTPLQSLTKLLGDKINYARGLEISRTRHKKDFPEAIEAAKKSDIVLLFIGEESILSGESHCRADIALPGAQKELIEAIASVGKPVVAVVLAGRPLTFEEEAKYMDAVLYAWHPGTMAGPAITDILFGFESPSGKLPVTFPRVVGQIPIYYAQKNSGKPATEETWEKMYDIPREAFQLSIGNTNHYIDYGFEPWYHFGYGLSYSTFEYTALKVNSDSYSLNDSIEISALLVNTGNVTATEVAQLYIRDLVGSRTRPVKELKGFKRITLKPGEKSEVVFKVHTNQLGFHNQEMDYVTEPGYFTAGIGGSSDIELTLKFLITK